jgi:4-amino-4-deoxy-L-arabinose transferase-like glycosyltransferase
MLLATSIRLFGQDLQVVQLLQAVMGGAVCLLVFEIARNISNTRSALFAALTTCFHPWLINWSGYILTESLFVLLITASVAAMVRLMKSRNLRTGIIVGGLFGLTALTRTSGLPAFLLVILAWPLLMKRGRSRWLSLLVVVMAFTVVYAPWPIRNYIAFERVILTSTDGAGLFAANQAGQTTLLEITTGNDPSTDRTFPYPPEAQTVNEVERYEILWSAGLRAVLADVGEFVRRSMVRMWLFWSPGFPTHSTLHNSLNLLFYLPLYLLAGVGMTILFRTGQRHAAFLILVLFLCFTLIHGATVVDWDQRYRLPLQPMLAALAGIGGARVLCLLMQRRGAYPCCHERPRKV